MSPERERVVKLRNFLATLNPERFDMSTWGELNDHSCRTAACVGGWAARLFNAHRIAQQRRDAIYAAQGRRQFASLHLDDESITAELLGLTYDQGQDLFYPPDWTDHHYTPEQAVFVLDHYLETGEIDWSVAEAIV